MSPIFPITRTMSDTGGFCLWYKIYLIALLWRGVLRKSRITTWGSLHCVFWPLEDWLLEQHCTAIEEVFTRQRCFAICSLICAWIIAFLGKGTVTTMQRWNLSTGLWKLSLCTTRCLTAKSNLALRNRMLWSEDISSTTTIIVLAQSLGIWRLRTTELNMKPKFMLWLNWRKTILSPIWSMKWIKEACLKRYAEVIV